jgi:hypothetical protein
MPAAAAAAAISASSSGGIEIERFFRTAMKATVAQR